jgi:NCAIR mutase (PurE)-related protein
MREILARVAAGELSPAEAEAAIRGYVIGDAGRFDAAREQRRGVPEAILAEGKTVEEVIELLRMAVDSTGHAVVTRLDAEALETVAAVAGELGATTVQRRAGGLVVHAPSYEPPTVDAVVGIVTGGTGDAGVAAEAAMICEEMGLRAELFHDVGVASIDRVLDVAEQLRTMDALVVCAGREGALPTVVAGLVDVPVIGVPVGGGYGHAAGGEAALAGLLQSCTVLSVVNIDAGFVAGAQAGIIARAVASGRA